jgi:hypothetical protein
MRTVQCVVKYLANLPTRSVTARPEGAIAVAADNPVVVSRFYVKVKRICFGNIRKMGTAARIDNPAFSTHNYLGELPPGHIVARVERTVSLTADNPVVVSRFYVRVEGIGNRNISEVRASMGVYDPTLGQHYYLG